MFCLDTAYEVFYNPYSVDNHCGKKVLINIKESEVKLMINMKSCNAFAAFVSARELTRVTDVIKFTSGISR